MACISVLTLHSFCSASAVQCDTLLLPLPSLFNSLKYLKFLIFLLKCELTGPINILLVLVRLLPVAMCFARCKPQQRELEALGKGYISCICSPLL